MSYKDYYQVLGVTRDASASELQRRYRSLAKKYHPDVSSLPDAEARFKELGEAYEVLKDPEKRALYDKWGQHWRAISEGRQPPRGAPGRSEMNFDFGSYGYSSSTSDLNSIFEQVFGAGRRRPRGARRNDQETTLKLGVGAAFKGGRREIQFAEPNGGTRRLVVSVPPGVRDEQRIRLGGQASGGRGDLFLRVRLTSDSTFRLAGDDVFVSLRIAPQEAALGAVATLTTLEGPVKIKVPPGSSSGRQIRLRSRGYPRKDGGRGDLFAEIQVVVPAELSDEERALYERLGEVSGFDPRA